MVEDRQNQIIEQSLRTIDKKKFLLNLLEQQKMNKLTAEILKVNQFAQGLYFKKNNDKVVNFLISLDLLVKGVLTHW